MTIETLNAYAMLRMRFLEAREDIAALEMAAYPSGSGDGGPRGSGTSDKVSKIAIELADKRARLNFIEAESAKECAEAEDFIESIPIERVRTAFKLRFKHCLRWEVAAAIIGGDATSDSVRKMVYRYLEGGNNVSSDEKDGAVS